MLFLLACTTTVIPEPAPSPAPPSEPAPVAEPLTDEMKQAVAVVEALPPPAERHYDASHILVQFEGAVDAPSSVTRSERDAFERAKRLREQAQTDFAAVARRESDGPSAPRDGRIGIYAVGTMVPAFERAVASVKPGEIGPLVRTPFGWHVVRREAVETVSIRHIQIGFQGARGDTSGRTRAEAQARIDELSHGLTAENFAERAAASEDATATVGGDLGVIARGQMVPAFEDTAFGLEPGQISGVVETPYGLHLILRTK